MSPRRKRPISIVLMGVAGAGKSTVMEELVERLGWPSLEGDALHGSTSVAKMGAGVPLSDADREPWLDAIAAWIGDRERERASAVLTCSALRRTYRDRLRRVRPSVWFVHLTAPAALLMDRIEQREGHFMPASMLASQLATLEPLGSDEPGFEVDASGTPAEIADRIVSALRLDR